MKKIPTMLIAAAMVFSLTACAGNMSFPTAKDNQASSSEQPTRQTEATAEPSVSPENATNSSITAYSEVETEVAVDVTPEAEVDPQTEVENESSPDGIRPEFREAMDSYEAFYTEYCEFMESYSENPTDLTLIAQYADMLVKAEEMNKAFEAWDEDDLSSEELKYYLDVNNRVMQMLVDVAD